MQLLKALLEIILLLPTAVRLNEERVGTTRKVARRFDRLMQNPRNLRQEVRERKAYTCLRVCPANRNVKVQIPFSSVERDKLVDVLSPRPRRTTESNITNVTRHNTF